MESTNIDTMSCAVEREALALRVLVGVCCAKPSKSNIRKHPPRILQMVFPA